MQRLRRPLLASLAAAGAIAVAAPPAQAASDQSLDFGIGSVRAVEAGEADNNVAFTVTSATAGGIGNLRLFIDTFNTGESYVSAAAVGGVVTTPLKATSTAACQVYSGSAFAVSAATPDASNTSMTFTIPKDLMRPQPRIMLVDGSTATGCNGVDGSAGLQGSFAETRFTDPWPWATPAAPTGLTAAGGPGAITLSWTQPADSNGVHYQVWEMGVDDPVAENVTGSSYTINGLAPGVGHSYQIRAFRFWEGQDGRQFSGFTGIASAIASAFPPPRSGAGGQGVKGASGRSANAKGLLAAPKGMRARASRNRVTLTLPKVPNGSKLQILRATGKKGSFSRKATTSRRTWTDRRVKAGTTYRYRIVRVTSGGQVSAPSTTVTVRVPRR